MPIPAADKPFVLHLLRLDEKPGGVFRPAARIALTPALRTSGLLRALSGDELRSLLLVLTYAHPNGHVQPSLLELARALHQPQGATRAQMRRLERFLWQGRPLLHEIRRESGLHAYAPSPRILGIERVLQSATQKDEAPTYRAAGREAVLARSRAHYAHPREDVEREIALAHGWEWPPRTLAERQALLRQKALEANGPPLPAETTNPFSIDSNAPSMNTPSFPPLSSADPQPELRRDLETWGVPAGLIERLLADYAPERIRNQLDWLPFRNAEQPGRFLVAAIQKDYAPPAAVRGRRALEQAILDSAERTQTGKPPAAE